MTSSTTRTDTARSLSATPFKRRTLNESISRMMVPRLIQLLACTAGVLSIGASPAFAAPDDDRCVPYNAREPGPGQVITCFDGSLSDLEFFRPQLPTDYDVQYFYDGTGQNPFTAGFEDYKYFYRYLTPTTSGQYAIVVERVIGDDDDTLLLVYKDTFVPEQPLLNLIAGNDDSPDSLLSHLDMNLEAGRTYVVVMTTYSSGSQGDVVFTVTGPGAVNVSETAPPEIDPVDTTSPEVVSITLQDSPAANTQTLTYIVEFSEPVRGVLGSHFGITGTGTVSGTVSSVSGEGASYEIVVDVSGEGYAQLVLEAGTSIVDEAGNGNVPAKSSAAHTVDTVAPAAPSEPMMDSGSDTGFSESDGITFNTTPQITGAAEIGSFVELVSDRNGHLGTALTDAEGIWRVTPTLTLLEGLHELTATATDAAGNVGTASATGRIRIDTTAPSVTSWSPELLANSATAEITIQFDEYVDDVDASSFVLVSTGSAEGQITQATASEGEAVVSVSGIAGTGTLDISVPEGAIKDIAGNLIGATNIATFNIDRDAPTKPSRPVLDINSDTGIDSSDGVTKINRPTFVGTAEPGSTVWISAGATELGSTVVSQEGNWSYTPFLNLPDATHAISVVAVDAAGNRSESSDALDIQIDTTAPVATFSATSAYPADGSAVFTVSFDDRVYGFDTQSFVLTPTGTASGVIAEVTAAEGNVVDVTVTNITGTGSLRLDVAGTGITDLAGNVVSAFTGGTAHQVDLEAPEVDGVSFDQAAVNSANQAAISFTLAGAEVDATAYYTITSSEGGTPVTGDVVINAADQQVAGIDVSGLPDGTLTVTVNLIDAAYNAGAEVTAIVEKDTVAPAQPSQPDLLAESDSGFSNTDNITNVVRPKLAGTAEADSTVEIYVEDVTTSEGAVLASVTADPSGNWSYEPGADLVEGVYNITVTSIDLAGNISAESPALNLTIDTTAPGISSVSFDEAMVDGTNVNAQSFTLSDAELGIEASYSITNSEGGVSVTGDFTITDADQQITVPSLVSLEDGNLILDLTLTDAAGNTRVETDVIVKNVNPVLALPLDLIEATDGSTIAVPDVVISGSVSSSITVEITVTDGTVEVDASRLGAVAGNATESLTLEGGLAEINAALATLTYTAPVNATGLRDLLVTVEDDLGSAAGVVSLQINDRADISTIDGSSVTYYYGGNPVQVTQADVVITDLDNTHFGGGVLSFGIVDRVRLLDMVSIVETSDVKLGGETYGSAVQVDGVLIGTLRNTFELGEDVQVAFNNNATPDAVAKLLKALTFATEDKGPANGSRTLEIRLNDGKAVRTVSLEVLLRQAPPSSDDIEGGVISYPVAGTPDAPVRINNARVVNGATLSNVIIGANTDMESGVIIGENVRFESEASIPAGLNLTGALRSLNWQTGDERSVVMLDGDVLVPGASDDDMSIIRAIQLLGEYEPAGNQLEQDQQTGEILVITDDFHAMVLPVTVTMAGPDEQPGTYVNENGDVVFVSVNRRVVLSYPVLASKPGFMAMLAGAGLQITYDERANMQVFSTTIQVDGREIQTVTAEGGEFYYSARPDVLSLPAHRSQTPGLVEYALPGLGSPRGLSIVYEEEGVLREQDLVPASPDWFGLKDSLLAIDGIDSVSLDAQGIITVMLDGQTLRARLEYVVFVGREQEGDQVIIREAGDKTGNGTTDYEVVYTNGNVQYLYVY